MKRLIALLATVAFALQPLPAEAAGGPSNIVIATNRVDGRLMIQGNLQVHREPGIVAAPVNFAFANASCLGCQTLAVALQLNFANRDARYIAPQNAAVAVNADCDGCHTVAIAYQIFLQVDDPTGTPPGVAELMRELDANLRAVSSDPHITLEEAEARIDDVIARFGAIATSIDQQRSSSQ